LKVTKEIIEIWLLLNLHLLRFFIYLGDALLLFRIPNFTCFADVDFFGSTI